MTTKIVNSSPLHLHLSLPLRFGKRGPLFASRAHTVRPELQNLLKTKEMMNKEMMQSKVLEQVQANLLKLTRLLEQTGVEPKPQVADGWIEGKDVMKALNISRRALQNLRDKGVLGYSRLAGKFYYRVSDVDDVLKNNYVMFKIRTHGKTQEQDEASHQEERGGMI